jgi:ketosteroid isomerase-like protein
MHGDNVTGSKRNTGAGVHQYLRDVKERTSEINFSNVIWRTTHDGLAIFQADGRLSFTDGRPYENHYLMMFEVAGGKIVYWREYFSPIIWARAFGVPLDSLPS